MGMDMVYRPATSMTIRIFLFTWLDGGFLGPMLSLEIVFRGRTFKLFCGGVYILWLWHARMRCMLCFHMVLGLVRCGWVVSVFQLCPLVWISGHDCM